MTSTDGMQNRGASAVPDAGAQRPLATPASQSAISHAQAQPSVRPLSGQAPVTSQLGGAYNQPTGTPGSAQWVSQGSQLRPGSTQWPATSMGGAHAYLGVAAPVGAAGYRIPPNVSQAYPTGQSPAYVTASGVRSETAQQQQQLSVGSSQPSSAPLQSLAGTMAFAAARPVGTPRAPGAAAPYRIPTSQAAAPRGQIPQISSQAYIKQASAQLQGFSGYPYPYLQAQGASAFPFGRSQPLSSSQMRPVGQPPIMQQLRPVANGQHVGGALPASSAFSNPYYPGGMRALTSYAGGRSVPISGPTASIPHIKRPGAPKVEWLGPTSTHLIPGVITVSDRKVRVTPGEEETTLMYVLLRRWVQNDPSLPPPISSQPDQPVSRPKLVKETLSEEPDLELPKPEPAHPSSAMFSPEDLLRVHKRHWRKVRRYHMVKRNIRLDRYCLHLAELIPEPNLRANSPMESDTPSQQLEPPQDDPVSNAVPSQPLAVAAQAPVAGGVTHATASPPPRVASDVAGALKSEDVPVPKEVKELGQLSALQ